MFARVAGDISWEEFLAALTNWLVDDDAPAVARIGSKRKDAPAADFSVHIGAISLCLSLFLSLSLYLVSLFSLSLFLCLSI